MEQLADDRMTRTTRLLQHTAILSGAHTGKLTMRMVQALTCMQDDQLLAAFMQENILNFSGSRERARYYFVKYLCDYLTCQTELAAKAKAEHRDLSDILPLFKGTNRLPAMSPEALVGTLTEAPVSCAALFDRFNMFYFGYVSVDWLEMVMDELDGDLSQLDPAEKAHLASCLRSYYPKWKQMTDDQIIQAKLETDEAEEERLDAMTAKEFYQTGRSGENSIRSYLQGTLDLDRTSLLFYLLFFGRSLPSTHPDRLSRSRLDEILSNCGFSPLDEKGQDGLDSFVIGFLTSREPSLYLAQTISDYAARRENFHLFKLYSRSVSHQARLEKVFGDGEKA